MSLYDEAYESFMDGAVSLDEALSLVYEAYDNYLEDSE
jgi:hypothetical protein